MVDKLPPQNIDAEQSILGAILIDKEAVHRVADILDVDSFYKEAHKLIFKAMLRLLAKGEPLDLVTVTEELRSSGHQEQTGGAFYLTDLINAVPTSANIEYYARIIMEKAILRRLISTGSEIVTSAFEENADVDSVLDVAQKLIFDVAQKKSKKNFFHVKDILPSVMDRIEEVYENKGQIQGVSSGFPDYDKMTAGFTPADLIIIAARPSMGKTALALTIAQNAAVKDKKIIALFSCEMSMESLVQRMLCSDAEIDAQKLRTGNLFDYEWKKLTRSLGRLSEAPIYIDDTPSITPLELRAKARRLKIEHGLDMIVVDYLQLMSGSKSYSENRTQEIAEIARSLKGIARELQVPVIALSQLSRAVEQRNDRIPRLSDLRESGEIEQTADLVVFIHREDYYDQMAPTNNQADIIIAKHRNGPTGTIQLVFRKELAKFVNKERSDIAPPPSSES